MRTTEHARPLRRRSYASKMVKGRLGKMVHRSAEYLGPFESSIVGVALGQEPSFRPMLHEAMTNSAILFNIILFSRNLQHSLELALSYNQKSLIKHYPYSPEIRITFSEVFKFKTKVI